jgi:two-component system, sensor histidine kinase
MLRRILQNIISNGLRYTRKGGVLVGARIHKGAVRIEVADTGIGIPPNEYEAIFEEFHRVPTSHADHAGDAAGLGLGLAIVRRMVDALSHQIAFRSIEGRGTRFLLHLPQAQIDAGKELAPAEREAALPADRLVGCNVLLAENDRAVLAATASLLEGWGCNVRLCVNSEEAQEMVAGSWVPDIVLADQHLDDGDRGTELIGLMRARISPQLPALLVTADPSPQLADRARAADFELMQKPVRPAALRALMTHLVDRRD